MVDPAKKEKGPVKCPSAQKRQIQSEKRRVANKTVRSRIKTKVKAFRESATVQSPEMLQEIYSLADKAAKKNVVSRNKANRIKSRLALRMRKASAVG